MIRVSPRRPLMGLTVLACVVGLAACGGGGSTNPSHHGAATASPLPGAGDTAICQIITKATTAYNAKDYVTWRSDMAEVAGAADSAQYVPLKKYAEEVKGGERVERTTTATTTRSKSKSKTKGTANISGITGVFATLGGYLGLQHVCAKLASPGSTSSGQGAPAQQGRSCAVLVGIHRPPRAETRGKVTVGF